MEVQNLSPLHQVFADQKVRVKGVTEKVIGEARPTPVNPPFLGRSRFNGLSGLCQQRWRKDIRIVQALSET
jgi:hypothetical protein